MAALVRSCRFQTWGQILRYEGEASAQTVLQQHIFTEKLCAGFVRMAIEQNAKLVPVVVLGELSALQNPIDLPDLQRWTYKHLGFPIPYWVVGRWGVSPFPKREGLKFIIGKPISAAGPHTPGTKVSKAPLQTLLQAQLYA